MNSQLSFEAADSKNFIKDAIHVIRDPITGRILQGACAVATMATAVSVGGAAPVAAVVCGAAGLQSAIGR
jgi:hypothetical protein